MIIIKWLNFELSFYIVQQLVSQLLYTEFYLGKPIFTILVLCSGVVMGINPCIISLLPISIAYTSFSIVRKNVHLTSFLCGLCMTSVSLLFILSIVGYRYNIFFSTLPVFSAIVSILVGLFCLNILKVHAGLLSPINHRFFTFNRVAQNFSIGCILAINALPCGAPILLSLLSVFSSSNNHLLIGIYILVYLSGYICPIVVLIIAIKNIQNLYVSLVTPIINFVVKVSSCFMLGYGILKLLEVIYL